MVEFEVVTISIPSHLKRRIDNLAEKKMSNFSQVLREAAGIGLEKMER